MIVQRLLRTALLLAPVGMLAAAAWAQSAGADARQDGAGVRVTDWTPIGSFDSPRLGESSGLIKSRKYPGIFWTHNDSGNPPVLFAVKLTGEVVAEFRVAGAQNIDWEGIAIDDNGRIYIGDIGDNRRSRPSYELYELPEPDPFARPVKPVKVTQVLRYHFPDGQRNCEALFVYQGKLHIINKKMRERPTLYRLDPKDGDRLTPTPVCTVPFAPITAADVSPDGKRLAVCSYGQLAVFEIGDDLSKIGEAKPTQVLFPTLLQTEGCCFDGDDVIITAESRQIWRINAADIQPEHRLPDADGAPQSDTKP